MFKNKNSKRARRKRARRARRGSIGRASATSVFFALVAACVAIAIFGSGGTGSGRAFAAEETIIGSAEEFREKFADRRTTFAGVRFKFASDIELGNAAPIGSAEYPFCGEIDGNGHAVTLNIESSGDAALIARLGRQGRATNLVVKGSVKGRGFVAGVAAISDGEIARCVNLATIEHSERNDAYVGGVCAKNGGRIDECVNLGEVKADRRAGGICGLNDFDEAVGKSEVLRSVALGTMVAMGSDEPASRIGGLIGECKGRARDNYARTRFEGFAANARDIGLLAGYASAGNIRNYALRAFGAAFGPTGNGAAGMAEKTDYDFLSDDGVEFEPDAPAEKRSLRRANAPLAMGYLYAPAFLLAEGNAFASEEIGSRFALPLFPGEGTSEAPYAIGSNEEWRLFASNSRSHDYSGRVVTLASDISADRLGASESAPFAGEFDGNGKTIEACATDYSRGDRALFCRAGDCVIKNFVLSGKVFGKDRIAGAVARVSGAARLKGISIECAFHATEIVGGLVAEVEAAGSLTIENCRAKCEIDLVGANRGAGDAGGMVGRARGPVAIWDSASSAKIRAEYPGRRGAGGLIGSFAPPDSSEGVSIDGCVFDGEIDMPGSDCVGGAIGSAEGGRIDLASIVSAGRVRGGARVAGLAGEAIGAETRLERFAALGAIEAHDLASATLNLFGGSAELADGYSSAKFVALRGADGNMAQGLAFDALALGLSGAEISAVRAYFNSDRGESEHGSGRDSADLTLGDLDEAFGFGLFARAETGGAINCGMYPHPRHFAGAEGPFGAFAETGTGAAFRETFFVGPIDGSYVLDTPESFGFFVRLCGRAGDAYASLSYSLGRDIELDRAFAPIPTFKGKLLGNNHEVRNLRIESDGAAVGLFARLEGAEARDFCLCGGMIASTVQGAKVGALCAECANSAITGVCADCSISCNLASLVGGLAATVDVASRLERCFFSGRIEGGATVGGLIGANSGTLTESFFGGRIDGGATVGGLIGTQRAGRVSTCHSTGRMIVPDGADSPEAQALGGAIGEVAAPDGFEFEKTYVAARTKPERAAYAFFGRVDREPAFDLGEKSCYYLETLFESAYAGAAEDGTDGACGKGIEFFASAAGEDIFRVEGFEAETEPRDDGFGADRIADNKRVNAACDAFVAPRIAAFESDKLGETAKRRIRESREMRIYGEDAENDLEYGGTLNPYLVTEADHFGRIVLFAGLHDYAGKHFSVRADIDLSGMTLERAKGRAIGAYAPGRAGNRFRGAIEGVVREGSRRPEIKGIDIRKATLVEDSSETILDEYLGLIAYAGPGCAVRNLIFRGQVRGRTRLGGLMGRADSATIENCVSFIDCIADPAVEDSAAAGLVFSPIHAVTATDAFCAGKISSKRIFGLLGVGRIPNDLTANLAGAWFAYSETPGATYPDEWCGNALKDCSDPNSGESAELVVGDDDVVAIEFKAPEGHPYAGRVLDAGDALIYGGAEPYVPVSGETGLHYFLRFCKTVSFEVLSLGSETPFATVSAYSAADGAGSASTPEPHGEFYAGQTVRCALEWTQEGRERGVMATSVRGRFSSDPDAGLADMDYGLAGPIGDALAISFEMAPGLETAQIVVAPIGAEGSGFVFSFGENREKAYDGKLVEPEVDLPEGLIEYDMRQRRDGAFASEIKGVGTYDAILRVARAEDGKYAGLCERKSAFEVKPKELEIRASGFDPELGHAIYDGQTVRAHSGALSSFGGLFSGAVEGDDPTISFSLKYAAPNAGEGIGLTMTGAESDDPNYSFASRPTDLGAIGVIGKMPVRFVVRPGPGRETTEGAGAYVDDAKTPLPGFPDGYFVRTGEEGAFECVPADCVNPVAGAIYHVREFFPALPGDGKYVDAATTPLPGFPDGYFVRAGEEGAFECVPADAESPVAGAEYFREEFAPAAPVRFVDVEYSGEECILELERSEVRIGYSILGADGAPTSARDAGEYELRPEFENPGDAENCDFSGSVRHILRIRPRAIRDVVFEKTAFVFSDRALNSDIKATFSVVSGGNEMTFDAKLAFYRDLELEYPVSEVIDAGTYYAKASSDNPNFAICDSVGPKAITVERLDLGPLKIRLLKDGAEASPETELKVDDELAADFSEDASGFGRASFEFAPNSPGVGRYDGVFSAWSAGGNPRRLENIAPEFENGVWRFRLSPIAYSGTVEFTIRGTGSANYANRESRAFALRIEKRKAHVALKEREFEFGDNLDARYEFEYFYDEAFTDSIPAERLVGAPAPTVIAARSVGENLATFRGSTLFGYDFSYYCDKAKSETIKIERRKIRVAVDPDGPHSKRYGSPDPESVPFGVFPPEGDDPLTVLPDGRAVALKGKILRAPGERPGEYAYLADDLAASNPDYDISFESFVAFSVTRRPLSVRVSPGQSKEYGAPDPAISLELADPSIDRLFFSDTLDSIGAAFELSRAPGEELGSYAYAANRIDSKYFALGYSVKVIIDPDDAFRIRSAVPRLNVRPIGSAEYGADASEISAVRKALDRDGNPIPGKFRLYVRDAESADGERATLRFGDETLTASFMPDDPHFAPASTDVPIAVSKRRVELRIMRKGPIESTDADGAEFAYRGSSVGLSDFECVVDRLVPGDDEYSTTLEITGDNRNATDAGFVVVATLSAARYSSEPVEAHCKIVKSILTASVVVPVAGIAQGDEFAPVLAYVGFQGADSRRDLNEEPVPPPVPTECGRHALLPRGGRDMNYEFEYAPAFLVIRRVRAESDRVAVTGSLPPTFAISSESLPKSGASFESERKRLDSDLGATKFIPIRQTLNEYISVASAGAAPSSGELCYTVALSEFRPGDAVYLRLASGETKAAEYSIDEKTDSGAVISFVSSPVVGVAVCRDKPFFALVAGWLPLVGAVACALALCALCAFVFALRRRRKKSVRYKATYARLK